MKSEDIHSFPYIPPTDYSLSGLWLKNQEKIVPVLLY